MTFIYVLGEVSTSHADQRLSTYITHQLPEHVYDAYMSILRNKLQGLHSGLIKYKKRFAKLENKQLHYIIQMTVWLNLKYGKHAKY